MGEDSDLLRLAVAGDGEAFGRLVAPHVAVARRVAYLHAPAADIDDVVQEALSRAWRQLPTLRAGSGLRAWIVAIVANCARNHHRGAIRRANWELRDASRTVVDDAAPDEVAIDNDEAKAVLEAVERLPEGQRDVVAYRYFLDLSEAETAEALGIPIGTVKSRLSRAMTGLRTELKGAGS